MHVTPAGTQVVPGMKFTRAGTRYTVIALNTRSGGVEFAHVPHDKEMITLIRYKKVTDPLRDLLAYPTMSGAEFDATCTLVE